MNPVLLISAVTNIAIIGLAIAAVALALQGFSLSAKGLPDTAKTAHSISGIYAAAALIIFLLREVVSA
jgi:hypothetical protein